MSAASRLKSAYLAWWSKPKADRAVYRYIRRHRPRRIVELGLEDGLRARRMISLAMRYCPDEPLQYTGIDPFEMRAAAGERLSLKAAHRQLCRSGARVRLLPGEPLEVLSMAANTLLATDLLLLGDAWTGTEDHPGWFYVPRMLTADSLVLVRKQVSPEQMRWEPLAAAEIEHRAAAHARSRRRAA